MYTPHPFAIEELSEVHAAMRSCGLAHVVTATASGPLATALPLFLVPSEGEFGTLYGHLARANGQWKADPIGDALAIFAGPDAYISPSWYATKVETGKVVPTWNYELVHAYGPVEFFEDPERLLGVVSRLTDLHEGKRETPWKVDDAPADFVQAQLRGIVGFRIPITRLEGKRKMSQNRNDADRAGVVEGLHASGRQADGVVALQVALKPDEPS
jgi:transcriptional regulator